MLPWRADAKPVENLSTMRRFMPYVSPRRNDSAFYMFQDIEVEAALEYLEKQNRERAEGDRLTLFHLFLRSTSQAFALRPGVNRFVKGGRLWQREGVYLSFAAKRSIEDGSPLITVKRRFEPETETLEQMVEAVFAKLNPQRAGRQSQSDKEMNLMLRLPGPIIQLLLKLADLADYFGLLPRTLIEPDPHYASAFLANLGSIDYPAGFHHLWEYGTCSLFGVMGRIEPGADGRSKMDVAFTYDERIEDGLYSYYTLKGILERIENPELLDVGFEELKRRQQESIR